MKKVINAEWDIMLNGKKRQLEIMSKIINAEGGIMSNHKNCNITFKKNSKYSNSLVYKLNVFFSSTFSAIFDAFSYQCFFINPCFVLVGIFPVDVISKRGFLLFDVLSQFMFFIFNIFSS
jgi:hypothetical protein